VSKFIVEGKDADDTYRPDADGAPFVLFCPAIQDWLPGRYETRAVAETVRKVFENLIEYYATVQFGHVNLYRLDRDAKVWGGKGKIAPVATFASVEEFERFTKKSIKEFNEVMTE
jgi:hypothetical protein